MDKCVIKTANKPCGNCIVRMNQATYKRVQEVVSKTGRSITSVTTELLNFALDRVEIEYTYREDASQSGQDSLFGENEDGQEAPEGS